LWCTLFVISLKCEIVVSGEKETNFCFLICKVSKLIGASLHWFDTCFSPITFFFFFFQSNVSLYKQMLSEIGILKPSRLCGKIWLNGTINLLENQLLLLHHAYQQSKTLLAFTEVTSMTFSSSMLWFLVSMVIACYHVAIFLIDPSIVQ
jgi:hypothetical protein